MTQMMIHNYAKALRAMLMSTVMLMSGTTVMADGVVVHGSVYGGGNLADVKVNTEVKMSTGTVEGNVFGGGKGKADNFECDKAMVGVKDDGVTLVSGEGENAVYTLEPGGTTVTITNGTVEGDVFGGGEVGRVERNTIVTIGEAGNTTLMPIVKGHVFGAGQGVETHGYSALVRGNVTVTIQGKAEVWQNVHGGGEKASVGRYEVATTQALADQYHVRLGMPCFLKAGGKCTVNIQDEAVIGKDDIDDSGDVFGAGQGVTPIYNNEVGDVNRSKRMVTKTDGHDDNNHNSWDYYEDEDGKVDYSYVWEYFATEADYLQYVETLGRASATDVVIGGKRGEPAVGQTVGTITASSEAPTITGTVYGGSESGFVYYSTEVNIKKGTVKQDVFGGGKGLATYAEAGRVRINTNLTISDGTIKGNVYGGGSLGDVGIIDKTDKDNNGKPTYNYFWKKTDGTTRNTDENNKITGNNTNTGVCTVTISGGTIGLASTDKPKEHGNVFGAGRGSESTWWCEKAMAFATNVTVKKSDSANTLVYGNVYGGGEVGRVADDTKVTIGTAGGSDEPDIKGSVYGAGAGIETHGYSALVRGNALVTVQGSALVEGSVYGGGEIASVGKFTVVKGLPTKPETGGTCTVNIIDNAKIGTSGTTHHVFGACKGVTPHYNSASYKDVYSMQTYENRPDPKETPGDTWDYWVTYNQSYTGQKFIKRYYKTKDDYLAFLNTLALTSNPHVTIGGTWTANETTGTVTASSGTPSVYGSVYGGGQRGETLGAVDVNIVGGDIHQDVYGGGALADTNLGNWDVNGYVAATGLTAGTSSVTGLYTRTGTEGNYTYTKITDEDATAADGTTYYRQEATWAHTEGSAYYKTTVDLTGGYIHGDAYGGGLGQRTGFNSATENIEATVWGDIDVTLDGTKFEITYDETTDQETDSEGNTIYVKVVKSGRVFGCNNLLGSPQGDVTVTVNQTVEGNTPRTAIVTENGVTVDHRKDEGTATHTYELASVYGGGNLAPYTATGKKAHVIINGCDNTSILTVYGGGNAAPVPETDVDVFGCFEIGSVFGGGNGKDKYKKGDKWVVNPGADVNGSANTLIYGGTVHEAYGGSNEKGTVHGDVTIDIADSGLDPNDPNSGYCPLDVAQLVGAGKNADVDGNLKIIMGCKPNVRIPLVFGGADNANVNGDVELTITSGNFGNVVGGNNNGGRIKGHIILNIEETTCIPLNIEHIYLCGYNAAYSQYGYYVMTEETEAENGTGIGATTEHAILSSVGKLQLVPRESADDPHLPVNTYSYTYNEETETAGATWTVFSTPYSGYDPPVLNIASCTSIGEVFGGGYGATATVYGNPTVNINMIPGDHAAEIDRDGVTGPDDSTGKLLGAIGDVYGGGDAAAVYGNTMVNIGTETTVQLHESIDANGVYTMSDNRAVTGAYITGNVYGGGKLANVGETHLAKDENNKDIDVIDIKGSTFVNIGAVKGTEILDAQNNPTGRYNYTSVSFTPTDAPGIFIGGNVYGGGMGEAAEPEGTDTLPGAFRCGKAMVTKNTNVAIGNGTIGDGNADHGHVYGGGEKGRVEENTSVTIGCEDDANSKPVITGNVFGAGKGVNTHGYSALVRGNSYVTVQGEAKVKKSVYGGGEIASVGKYNINAQGLPESLANQGSGYCTVIVRDNAVIGPDAAMVMTATGYPDDMGHVFGAGKGVLPYEGYADNEKAWRVTPGNTKQEYLSKTEAIDGTNEEGYLPYVETLGLATQTYVTIDENAFVKGSVYGGSENGYVQHDTQVNIQGNCQIGNGYVQMTDDGTYLATANMRGVNRRYTAKEWEKGHLFVTGDTEVNASDPSEAALRTDVSNNYTSSLPECASWPYGQATGDDKYAPWDKYADVTGYDSKGGRTTADDGHTFYGNVFGGGSGLIPYRPGQWHPEAGSVGGNTVLNITGGHILTNIYGGNELTDVYGKCTVNFGGTATLGVPRTLKQIAAHPLTCYLFGAGKGDQRVLFNKKTNVKDVEVNITGGTIYGSVFGGGEDGHVHRDVKMTIGNDDHSGPTIGQWGTSYVDGNIFGGGRGFGADAYTAGNVAGSVKLEIKGGNILGSVYGGGRLGSVGYGLFESTNTANYGVMQDDNIDDEGNETTFYKEGDVGLGRGHIDITISGGTIGNGLEYIIPNATNMAEANIPESYRDISKWDDDNNYWTQWKEYHKIPKTEFDTTTGRLTHTKGGNVFAGGMGNFYKQDGQTYINGVDWWKLGNAKSTTVTITGGTIKSNVYGGGELGQVVGYHTAKNAANQDVNVGTEVNINSGTIGTNVVDGSKVVQYTFGSVFGGGYGSLVEKIEVQRGTTITSYPKYIAGRVKAGTKVNMTAGSVLASVYGGGEMAAVGESKTLGETLTAGHSGDTYVSVSGGTVGIAPITISGSNRRYFGGAKMGNVYGGGSGHGNTVRSGHVYGNTNLTISAGSVSGEPNIYHNVYGGGAYGSVGDFTYQTGTDAQTGTQKVIGISGLNENHSNSGVATVTITGGTIGYDGKENGMVFGSSRGDINEPGARDDHCAWVYDANVIIGTAATGTPGQEGYVAATGPSIKGTVYGSGENGHVFNDAEVTINYGTIGIDDNTDPGYTVTSNGTEYAGAAYPYRGNVYGGGCGTDMYYSNHALETHDGEGDMYNSLAGIVYGTTTVNITGGKVVRNVYGAGAMGSVGTTDNTGAIISGGTTNVTVSGGIVGYDGNDNGNVFGAARGSATSSQTGLSVVKTTNVNISGSAVVKGNVYGGGEAGDVGTYYTVAEDGNGKYKNDNVYLGDDNSGVCNVTVTGGAINGHVFGAGKGEANTFTCQKAMVKSVNVSISAGTIGKNVYGGGEVGRVEYDTRVTIGDESGSSAPAITGSVFGAGAGVETHGYSALVRGNTYVIVQNHATVGHSVYGGGEIASVGKYGLNAQKMPEILKGGGYCYVTVKGDAAITGDVFGSGEGITPAFNKTNADRSKRSRRMTMYSSTDFPSSAMISAETGTANAPTTQNTTWEYYESGSPYVWEYYQEESDYLTYLETLALATHPEVTIEGNVTIGNDVYGGGERGITKGSVIVNINGGSITRDVYGGGALANTNTTSTVQTIVGNEVTTTTVHPKTTVNLHGGVIGHNVYGGGLGQLAKDAVGTQGDPGYVAAVPAVEAKVYGDVLVKLNEPTTSGETTTYGNCVVKGNIFGCNNLNGSPQAGVTVHIFKTQGWTDDKGTADKSDDESHDVSDGKNDDTIPKTGAVYELEAVYGGGNLAAYSPSAAYSDDETTRATAKTQVIIDGCNLTSIKNVYGGGNAASVPATEVTINGTYEVDHAFGGGNGADPYTLDGMTYLNPGANVGYRSYATHEWDASKGKYVVVENADADTKANREQNYAYGTGKAQITINAGTVHTVYGGSNTKGNVRTESLTILDDQSELLTCEFNVDNAYGGGRNADQDGKATLRMECISGLGAIYGGAENADVESIEMNIINGTYSQVFGGNHNGGRVMGNIVVNVEETGCKPVIIGELYGGGNNAGYSIYGYKEVIENGKPVWKPRTSATDDGTGPDTPYADPVVNVKSFTSIGNIFGGGYGADAVIVGNPHLNINVGKGKYYEQTSAERFTGWTLDAANKRYSKTIDEHNVYAPAHEAGAIGAIYNIYGGGNAADVYGDTYVNVGTEEYVEMKTKLTDVRGYCTRTGTGTQNDPYVYNPITGENAVAPVANTSYYMKVEGVDIRGNVFGGGNAAKVIGNTNVQVGRKVGN